MKEENMAKRLPPFSIKVLQEYIYDRIQPEPNTGCWLWERACSGAGYGQFGAWGRRWYAHRAAWLAFRGEEPGDLEVCHSCDVKPCVNPDHLFLGTHRENMLDAWKKGIVKQPPTVRGSDHAMSLLDEESVADIRERLRNGETRRSLAKEHDVTVYAIHDIASGRNWAHVD